MDDLLREFVGETLDMMEAVADDLVVWEADPTERSGIDGIFRTIHTVKGSSGFFDLPRIAAVSHAAEELLDALRSRRREPDPQLVATVLSAFERIRFLTLAISSGQGEPAGDDSALIAALLADVHGTDRDDRPDVPHVTESVAAPTDMSEPHGDVPQAWRSVRLPVGLLDELMNGVSDLVLARNEVAAQLRAQGLDPAAMPSFERLSSLLGSVRASVGQMRMVPLRNVFAPLPRLVRQLASELGKDVHIEIEGGEVEIDREVGESLRDPMVHVLRNAIDHGIENSAARIAAGKSASGTLRVSARQTNNRILITFDDDGAGISIDGVTRRAVDNGVISPDQAAALSAAKKAELIFMPGLSTALSVTGISGRGVGMDVVKANVERLGGFVTVRNRPGHGLTIEFDVPMTLTIISALAIDMAGQSFAIPRNAVEEVLLASSDSVQRQSAGGAGLVRVRGRLLPLLRIEQVLGLPASDWVEEHERAIILCRIAGNRTVALDVPDVRDHEELVIKPLPPLLLSLGLYSGMSLPDNGKPMLLLDVEGIAQRQILPDVTEDETKTGGEVQRAAIADMWLLFHPFGATQAAALPMTMVDRLVDVPAKDFSHAGGRSVARFGGALLPVAHIHGDVPVEGIVRVICVSDGERSVVVPTSGVGLMTSLSLAMPSSGDAPVLGLAQFDGDVVEMVDCYRLLARFGGAATTNKPAEAASSVRPIWVIDAGRSGWAASFLIPSLAAAGYSPHIVASRDLIDDDAPVLTVQSDATEGVALTVGDTTVDAYDRDKILAALQAPRKRSRRKHV